MPTRLLREGILSSEAVDSLDAPAEVFYRRLMSKVDDHGLFDARASILRASLFPLRTDRVREADISRWMAACQKAGLIVLYEADGKPYLSLLKTGWDKRSKPKYPLPPENSCKQPLAIPNTSTVVVVEGVVEVEGKALSGKPDVAIEILQFLNEKTGRRYQPVKANLEMIRARLKGGATADELRMVVAKKCREWAADEKMSMYLRPATLFNATKFAQYQGELGNPGGQDAVS